MQIIQTNASSYRGYNRPFHIKRRYGKFLCNADDFTMLADTMMMTMIALADKNQAKHKFYIVESDLSANDRYFGCLLPGYRCSAICAWTTSQTIYHIYTATLYCRNISSRLYAKCRKFVFTRIPLHYIESKILIEIAFFLPTYACIHNKHRGFCSVRS